MARREPTEETFLKDVANHEMEVLRDDGLYRHIQFRSTACGWNQWFELVTWPHVLTIHGDMGTWTFSRVEDMFTFFRSSKGLKINPHYWSEKVQSEDSDGGHGTQVYDHESFAERLLKQLENYYDLKSDDLKRVMEAVQQEVIAATDGAGRHAAYQAAYEFEFQLGEDPEHSSLCRRTASFGSCICGAEEKRKVFRFESTEIPSGMVYSYHFIWCLYAIVWGIQQWDKAKEVPHA